MVAVYFCVFVHATLIKKAGRDKILHTVCAARYVEVVLRAQRDFTQERSHPIRIRVHNGVGSFAIEPYVFVGKAWNVGCALCIGIVLQRLVIHFAVLCAVQIMRQGGRRLNGYIARIA